MNNIKIIILLFLLTTVIIIIGWLVGGYNGIIVSFIFGTVINFISYWYSDKIVLALYNAYILDSNDNPILYRIIYELCREAEISMPKLYIINNDTPNAFATGRNSKHAVIVLTTGIISILSLSELRGVLAHELAHIKNSDILINSIVATIAGAIMIFVNIINFNSILINDSNDDEGNYNLLGVIKLIVIFILTPLAATLIQLAISRSREFLADRVGSQISNNPEALAVALFKLEKANRGESCSIADVYPQTAHMFIVNPLNTSIFMKLFSTHPPTSERIIYLNRLIFLKKNSKNLL